MIVKVNLSALKNTRGYEYALRFVLGGSATVFTGEITAGLWPTTGGLFLAFPAIFCASVTLVEKHERERKQKVGGRGTRRGRTRRPKKQRERRWEAWDSSHLPWSSGSLCQRRGPSGLSFRNFCMVLVSTSLWSARRLARARRTGA